MKVQQIALLIIIFSALTVFFNTLGVFYIYMDEPGLHNQTSMESAVDGIYDLSNRSDEIDTRQGFSDVDTDAGGLDMLFLFGSILWNSLTTVTNLGAMSQDYIGGPVGVAFHVVVDVLTLYVLAWGLFQIKRKFSSKGVD